MGSRAVDGCPYLKELGKRRCSTLQAVCMDMWAAYVNLVREHAPQAQILFDRFHIVKHLQEAVSTRYGGARCDG